MFWNQTSETIEEQSQKVIDAGIGFVGSGCGIVSKTPNENLQAMIEVAKNHKY